MLGAHRMINRTCQDLLNQSKAAAAKPHGDNVTPVSTGLDSGLEAPLARGSPTSVLNATRDGAAALILSVCLCDQGCPSPLPGGYNSVHCFKYKRILYGYACMHSLNTSMAEYAFSLQFAHTAPDFAVPCAHALLESHI